MRYLLDTNIVSDLMDGGAKAEARLRSLEPTAVATSAVARGELLYGIRNLPAGRRRDALLQQAAPYLKLRCEPVPAEASDHYADVKIARERVGLALDENDLWIAATALALGATLVTRDSDFDGIEGLTIENWSA